MSLSSDPAPLNCISARDANNCVLRVSVVPNAKRTEVVGLHDGDLRVRLAAPPVDGKANDALVAWLARELDLPRREVSLLRGQSARSKQLLIAQPVALLQAWVARRLAEAGSS
jgi:uncharacterized protein